MIALGLILLIIGLVASIGILTTIGVILLVVGLILNLVPIGGTTRPARSPLPSSVDTLSWSNSGRPIAARAMPFSPSLPPFTNGWPPRALC